MSLSYKEPFLIRSIYQSRLLNFMFISPYMSWKVTQTVIIIITIFYGSLYLPHL